MKVLHFVTGGFSGATQVAIDIISEQQKYLQISSLLVLRRKRNTSKEKLNIIKQKNISYQVIPGYMHIVSIICLWKICRKFRPDVVVAHGFPEHILGRISAKLAKVPKLIHVEHNSKERYTWWKLIQAWYLAKYTNRIVGVSQGVAQQLIKVGFPADKVIYIYNGIDYDHFREVIVRNPLEQRKLDIIMVARFARQKDHKTLINAMKLLQGKGLYPTLSLVGGGKKSLLRATKKQVKQLGLIEQVKFLGFSNDVAELYAQHKVAVLITHWEGLPLSLIEAMASGCICVASNVVGVRELIQHGVDGFLVLENDAESLATQLEQVLRVRVDIANVSQQAKLTAANFSKAKMAQKYLELFF